MSELKWYVVRSISGQEKKAKTYLENEITRRKLNSFVPEILIPTEKVYEVRQGKKIQREKSFFPGYILINADLETNGEVLPLITNMTGIIGFLGEKGGASKEPVPLRNSEVERILGRMSGDASYEQAKVDATFTVGESVKVMEGAFNGFIGTIEEVFEDKQKLNVMVKIFGRDTPVELNYGQVEKEE